MSTNNMKAIAESTELEASMIKLKDKLLKSIEGIQESLQDFKGEGHFEGVDSHVLYHGLRRYYTFTAGQFYTDLTYSPLQKEYLLVYPSKLVARFGIHGREISPPYKIETTRFSKLTWANTMQCFLCWSPRHHEIYVAQANFVFLSRVYNFESIVHVMYDEGTKTVIAAAQNIITRYTYVLGTRVLQKTDQTIFKSFESAAVVVTLCDLAPRDSGTQRLFVSYLNNGYVLNLDTRSIFETRKSLHSFNITALMLYLPVMWLITGDTGGTVKCWDASWNLMMVFIGHTSSVLQLVAHPTLCGFVSVGGDKTLQVWSCTLRDKVERIDLPDAIRSVIVNQDEECLVTLSAAYMNIWYMHLLYSHHCALNASVAALFTPMDECHPCRTLVVSTDSLVRVVSPLTGVQLTVQHVPADVQVGGVVYSQETEIIYTIIQPKGDILVTYANQNPVSFWKVWLNDRRAPQITVLEVYEQIGNMHMTESEMKDPTMGRTTRRTTFRTEHSLIVAGREDGTIASLNYEFGTVEFVTAAHASSVKTLLANPAMNQLVSCGADNSIKVWRVFAQYKTEPILLHMSLYYSQTIASIATLREVLCLAISSKRTINHTVIMYNVTEKLRHDHAPHRDHSAPIVSMSACDALGLCATASQDRTVRVWNEINQLYKLLELNAMPQAMCFSSLQGDITLCIGKHLFKIRHERYLSAKYRQKIALYRIPGLIEETPKPFQRENVEASSESYMRILQPESSLPLFSLGVTGEVDKSMEMKRAKAYSQYNAREEDIYNIIEGRTVASKKIPSRHELGLKQWQTLISSIMSVSGVPQMLRVAGMKALNIREIRQRHTQKIQHLNLRQKYKGMYGRSFTSVDKLSTLPFNPLESPVATRGFIPNCILYKLLGIEKKPAPAGDKPKDKKRVVLKPLFKDGQDLGGGDRMETGSMLSEQSRASSRKGTESSQASSQKGTEPSQASSQKGTEPSQEGTEPSQTGMEPSQASSRKGSEVTALKKLTDVLTAGSSANIDTADAPSGDLDSLNLEDDEHDIQVYSVGLPKGSPWMNVIQTEEEKTKDTTGNDTKKVKPRLGKVKKKHVSKSMPDILTKSPSRTEETQRGDPGHITVSNAAIDLLVTEFTSEQSHDDFISFHDFVKFFRNLLDAGGTDFDITSAAKNIYDRYARTHRKTIKDALVLIIKTFKDKPDAQKLNTHLQILASLDMIDKDTIAALLALYTLSGRTIRRTILRWLTQHGLVDPHNMLEKHLDDLMADVKRQCTVGDALDVNLVAKHIDKWLSHWQRTLEYHMTQVLDQIKAGEVTTGVDSFLVKELEQMAERFLRSEQQQQHERPLPPKTLHGTKSATDKGTGFSGENVGRDAFKQSSKQSTIDIDLERNTVEMIVLIDDDVSKKRLSHVTPVDALNYFCELEARFNEPKSHIRRRHEEICLKDLPQAPDEQTRWGERGHPPPNKRIQLPLPKAQLAEPFNDGLYLPNPVLLTLRTSQKYFHPKSSYT